MPAQTTAGLALSVRLVLAGVLALVVVPVRAQPGDWSVDGGAERRDEIIRRYRTILENRPDQGPIFDRLLQELGTGDRFERVLDEYRARSEADPDAFAAHMLLGHMLRHADRLDDALEAYGRAIAAAPDDARGHLAAANVHRALGQRAEAEGAYEAALDRAGDDDARRVILRQLADLAFEAREWELAGAYVERLIAIDPRDAYTRMELAEILVRYERFDDALAQYEFIVDSAGRDTRQRAIALKDSGDVLAMMGRGDEALARYQQALGLVDPEYWLARELEQRIIAVYRQEDRLDELVALYEAEWSSPNVRQLNLLAALYDELGREQEAIDATRRALRRAPGSTDTRMALIRLLERAGETDEVIAQYRELMRLDRGDASVRFRLVEVYRRLGRREDAVAVLDEALRTFGDRPHVLIDIADRYVRFGEREKALAAYERLVRIDPDQPDNYVALGEFHFMEERRSEAERTWRRILDVVDDEATARAMLGDVFGDHGLIEEAVIEFERARRLEPEEDAHVRALARLYQDANRLEESLAMWELLSGRTDQAHLRGEAREAMVRIHVALGRLGDAIAAARERFEASPADVEAGYFLGLAYLEQDDPGAAEQVYLRVLERRQDDLIALLALEDLYTEQHRHADAIDVLLRIAEAHPERAREYYHRLAELSLRIYDDEQAVNFARLAVELNPDNAQAHARLGEIYRDMQRLDEAVLAYRQALLLDPRAFAYYFDLGEIYLALDRSADADELYRHVITAARDEVYLLRAGRRSIQVNHAGGTLLSLVGLFEPNLYDEDLGPTHLKLLVELYDRLTTPLIQVAEYGLGEQQAAAAAELDEVGRRALRPLLDALAGDDVAGRRTALRILAAQANPNAALPIARLIDGADETLRQAAALAVARIGDARALAPLVRAAESGGSLELVAIWGIARTGDPAAEPSLAAIVGDVGRQPRARALAVWGLGRCSAGEAGAAAVLGALADESTLVRQAALLAAGVLGLEAAAADARVLLEHGRGDVPLAAAWALRALPIRRENVEALSDAAMFGAPDVRAQAGASLAEVGRFELDPDPLLTYERSLAFYDHATSAFDVDDYLSGLLRWGLAGRSGDDVSALAAHVDVLSTRLGAALDSDPATRVSLLVELDSDDRGVALGPFTAGSGARRALLEHALAPHVARLRSLASDPDPRVRARATSVIGKLGGAAASDVASQAMSDASPEVVIAGIDAVARAGIGALVPSIRAQLDAESWQVRSAAARALGALGDRGGADALAALASHDLYGSVRAAAFAALLRVDAARAVDLARRGWAGLALPVRVELVDAARELGDAASAILELAAADMDERVRRAATAPRPPHLDR